MDWKYLYKKIKYKSPISVSDVSEETKSPISNSPKTSGFSALTFLSLPRCPFVSLDSRIEGLMMEVEGATGVVPSKLNFPPLKAHGMSDGQVQYRAIAIPSHRFSPLRKVWEHIFPLITGEMKIDVCVNRKDLRRVELKTTDETPDIDNLHKCAAFFEAFMRGFDVKDAEALLRIDEMRLDSFEIKDVKTLRGEHLSRAIGRLSGKGGKTKFAIENATRTRIMVADKKVHILGACSNLKVAKDALCSLILGSPAAKVYSKLRAVTARAAERF